MFLALIRFYVSALLCFFRPLAGEIVLPDDTDPHLRRYGAIYRTRRRWVGQIWLFAAIPLLMIPVLPLLVAALLGLTFLSLTILDESGQ